MYKLYTLHHVCIVIRPGKKNFGSGQLIFENWSSVPVSCRKGRLKSTQEHKLSPKTFMSATQNEDERGCR